MKQIIRKQWMRSSLSLIGAVAIATGMLSSCCEDKTENFDNRTYTTSPSVQSILLKGNSSDTRTIQVGMARQETREIVVTYRVDPDKVGVYNSTYSAGEEATLLPSEYYEIPEPKSTITPGNVSGSDVVINFKSLDQLDRDKVYVLPVTAVESSISMVESARTTYYVVKGGALVNTVADITKNFLRLKNASQATALRGLQELTLEVLVKFDKFDKLISTIAGVEGLFLLRVGDAGLPDNQLQLATAVGNVTDPSWRLETGKWMHIAMTYKVETREVEIYINGIKKGTPPKTVVRYSIDWARPDWFIGRSWDNNRWLEGQIAEVRVWNKVLTAEEINAKNHFYTVPPTSEGLAAYWKFDEGVGQEVKDLTGGGADLVAFGPLTWRPIELPEK